MRVCPYYVSSMVGVVTELYKCKPFLSTSLGKRYLVIFFKHLVQTGAAENNKHS